MTALLHSLLTCINMLILLNVKLVRNAKQDGVLTVLFSFETHSIFGVDELPTENILPTLNRSCRKIISIKSTITY